MSDCSILPRGLISHSQSAYSAPAGSGWRGSGWRGVVIRLHTYTTGTTPADEIIPRNDLVVLTLVWLGAPLPALPRFPPCMGLVMGPLPLPQPGPQG